MHVYSAASVASVVLDTPNCWNGVNFNKLRNLHGMLLKQECSSETALHEHVVSRIMQILDDLSQDPKTKD